MTEIAVGIDLGTSNSCVAVARKRRVEVVIGATSESVGSPPVPTVGGVVRLLNAARALVPSLDDAEVIEVLARDRPASPDNGPLIGRLSDREVLAAGHYRGGVLLVRAVREIQAKDVDAGGNQGRDAVGSGARRAERRDDPGLSHGWVSGPPRVYQPGPIPDS